MVEFMAKGWDQRSGPGRNMKIVSFFLLVGLGSYLVAPARAAVDVSEATPAGIWGDQGDGTYRNPILPGDFQNTDVLRVGSDYYYISATKELSPGMLILTSKDLVNWTYLGHAVPDITQINPRYNFDKMEGVNRGIWAGSLGYHDKKFLVYFTDPDFGIYLSTAVNPAGPWEPLTQMMAGPGWDDPCPFWDDDGQAYLVATNFHDGYKIHLFKMSPDGKTLQLDSDQVIHQSKESEANKIYKIKDYYYHFYSEVTSEGRVPFMERAKNIAGPYEERRQLIHKADGYPNQGGLLQTEAGDWYFVTHHGTAKWDGREASLLPVTWVDGWPVWGTPGPDGIGNMVWSGNKPIAGFPVKPLQTSDEFDSATLSPQWEWYFQPRADKWSLQERPGFLRLYACRPLQPGVLTKTANILTQRPLRVAQSEVTVKMDLSHMADGQVAGLSLFGKTYGAVGIEQMGNARSFYFDETKKVIPGAAIPESTTEVWLRASWDASGLAQFSTSTDGTSFNPVETPYQIANSGNYLGAKIGLYTANDKQESGYIDIDWFHYDVK